MRGWKNNDNIDFHFYDAHDLNNLRSGSTAETIKPKLRLRMKSTKLFMVLIGEKTKNLFKFVRWEMEIALEMGIPIVAVYLNKSKIIDNNVCPPIIRDELVLHVPYKQAVMKWAIDNWIDEMKKYKAHKYRGPVHLNENIYNELDI